MDKTVIVIPIYRDFTPEDKCSFEQCMKVLGHHTIVLIHPDTYRMEALKQAYPTLHDMPMAADNFTSVDSYNDMMLSASFYELFSEYEYMLIYQLDAYVFHDDLEKWVSLGYDYIGAPWLPNYTLTQRTVGAALLKVKRLFPIRNHQVHHAHLYYRTGNGGFSLRRIPKMMEVLSQSTELIAQLPHGSKARQEDVLLSVLLARKFDLKIPDWREALHFAFENAPQHSLSLTQGELPFGCHNWTSRRTWSAFWHKYIPLSR